MLGKAAGRREEEEKKIKKTLSAVWEYSFALYSTSESTTEHANHSREELAYFSLWARFSA